MGKKCFFTQSWQNNDFFIHSGKIIFDTFSKKNLFYTLRAKKSGMSRDMRAQWHLECLVQPPGGAEGVGFAEGAGCTGCAYSCTATEVTVTINKPVYCVYSTLFLWLNLSNFLLLVLLGIQPKFRFWISLKVCGKCPKFVKLFHSYLSFYQKCGSALKGFWKFLLLKNLY